MSQLTMPRRWLPPPYLLTAVAWALVCAIFIAQNLARSAGANRAINWQNDVLNEGVYWFAFALLTPLFAWLCRRFSLVSSPARKLNLIVHLIAAPSVAGLQVLLNYAFLGLIAVSTHRLPAAELASWVWGRPALLVLTITAFWKYWVIVALIHGVEYARLYSREHRAASELREQLTAAQLQQLKARLQPHFLFNTLNGIVVLMRDDPERGRLMLVRLSQLLRSVIDTSDEQVVPLREEMTLVERYLDIQRMRFDDRLRVVVDVPPETLDEPVPHFLIQPLVENAVQHGVSRTERGGAVIIRARREVAHLLIEVIDVPEGEIGADADSRGSGIGLTTTRERLRRLYGSEHRISIGPDSEGGTRVSLRIPLGAPAGA